MTSHKEKNLLPIGGKFFPLRVDPALGRLCPPGKQTGSHKYCLPLETWRKKMEVYPYTFKILKVNAN